MKRTYDFDLLRLQVCDRVIGKIDFSKELSEEEAYTLIDDALVSTPEKEKLPFSELLKLRKEVYNSLRKLDILQELLDDETITEIMINGKDNIFVERFGRIERINKSFESAKKLEDIVQQIVAGCNRTVNEASPIADARLASGERVNIVLAPVALNGPIVTIRRFPQKPITMDTLLSFGSLTLEAAVFLKRLVKSGYNIFISGGTGSGKTTFLNALSQYIPKEDRIITIEDSAELQLIHADNLVRLETRNRNNEECRPILIRDLIRTALRMRPERIIVGECRGEEALDMLQAMNTGHDGSLSTGHANSPKDMLSRLETMVLMGSDIPLAAIRGQIGSGIDIIVHLARMRDKSRKVTSITEIEGCVDGEYAVNEIFSYKEGKLVKISNLHNRGKLLHAYDEFEIKAFENEL